MKNKKSLVGSSTKTRKILLGTLIPIGCLVVATAVALPVLTQCSKTQKLSQVITNTGIGNIVGGMPVGSFGEKTIIDRTYDVNPNSTNKHDWRTEVNVDIGTDASAPSAIIKAKNDSKYFKGKVKVTFSILSGNGITLANLHEDDDISGMKIMFNTANKLFDTNLNGVSAIAMYFGTSPAEGDIRGKFQLTYIDDLADSNYSKASGLTYRNYVDGTTTTIYADAFDGTDPWKLNAFIFPTLSIVLPLGPNVPTDWNYQHFYLSN